MAWDDALENYQELMYRVALLVVCADGGANRLKDLDLTEQEEQECVRGRAKGYQYLATYI